MPELKSSSRVAIKATYVLKAPAPAAPAGGQVKEPTPFEKANFVRALRITPDEANRLTHTLRGDDHDTACHLAPLLESLDPEMQALHVPRYADIPVERLVSLAKTVDVARRSAGIHSSFDAKLAPAPVRDGADIPLGLNLQTAQDLSHGRNLQSDPTLLYGHTFSSFPYIPIEALIANLKEQAEFEPVGWLHLERLEMKPVGIERGELVSTIPMAPGESVRVGHKEWSIHSEELSRIVTDELENYAERGVEEKHDVAMSTDSENRRDTSLNFGVSASGGYGPVSITSTLSTTINASERQTRKDSANHAQHITQKASTRSRKEQKVSFRVETRSAEETESSRLIENKSEDVIRIDYYRMMRKWRVDLLRYGLRMTYDLVVPDPGSALRNQILELVMLDRELEQEFLFDVPITEVTRETWMELAASYGAALEPPPPLWKPSDPAAKLEAPFEETFIPLGDGLEKGRANWTDYRSIRIAIPAGYVFRPENFVAVWMSHQQTDTVFDVVGDKNPPVTTVGGDASGGWTGEYKSPLDHLYGMSNDVTIAFKNRHIHTMLLRVRYRLQLSAEAWNQWQAAAWQRLREAAEQQHYIALQRKRDRRERLVLELAEQDTLSLRRAEHEEIMKRTLQWLLGPGFNVSPPVIEYLLGKGMAPVGQDRLEPSSLNLNEVEWLALRKFGEYIKFIHQAVEWENVLYFLYPYFWGSSELGELKRNLKHPDPFRREFVRAGAARVVLPIRPGFERRFASFIATGIVPPNDNPSTSSRYLSIAEEVQAFARTNYPGIVPANPDDRARARPLTEPKQIQAWGEIQRIVRAVEQYAESQKRAKEPAWRGAPAESEFYPTETEWADSTWMASFSALNPNLPKGDPWGEAYEYRSDGSVAPFRIFTFGRDKSEGGEGEDSDVSTESSGNLIATWFEYTPTSGLDIQLNTPIKELA